MVKVIKIEPIAEEGSVDTNGNVLSVLMDKELNISKDCGGQGLCATCHIYVQAGADALTPIGRRERRTLAVITSCKTNSRLACQAKVTGDGVVVELPAGMYVNSLQDIEKLIGRRAETNLLHPVTGAVLVERGKLITRSMLNQLADAESFKASTFFEHSAKV